MAMPQFRFSNPSADSATSVCPGRYLAADTLSLFLATLLHVFDISAGVDASGKPVELTSIMESSRGLLA